MVIVARTFRDGKGAMAVDDIRHALGIPKRILSSVLSTLVEAGMLHEIHVGGKEFELSYAPARDISTLKVYDVLLAVDAHGEGRDSVDVSEPQELHRAAQVVDELKCVTSASAVNSRILDLL
jgi:DNA-binding IscR family transcriptional regulator